MLQSDLERAFILAGDVCDFRSGVEPGPKFVRKRADYGFVAFAKGEQSTARPAGLLKLFSETSQTADDAAGLCFCIMELRESGAETELFRITSVHSGDKGASQFLQYFRRELSRNKGGDGFIVCRRHAPAERIAEDRPFCFHANER